MTSAGKKWLGAMRRSVARPADRGSPHLHLGVLTVGVATGVVVFGVVNM
jgi:hypothetical protein